MRVVQELFESFTKSPGGFPYILIITEEVTTLEPIYGSTFADQLFLPQAGSSQAESTGPQATSTSPPQAGSSWADSADAQTASPSPKAVCTISLTGSTQAASTNSQGDSTFPLQAGNSQAESTGTEVTSASSQAGSSQAKNTDAQTASASPQAASTNSHGDSAASSRFTKQVGRQLVLTNPRLFQRQLTGKPQSKMDYQFI